MTTKAPSRRSKTLTAGQLTMLREIFAKNWCSTDGHEANIFWSLIRRGLIKIGDEFPRRLAITPEGFEMLKKYGGMK